MNDESEIDRYSVGPTADELGIRPSLLRSMLHTNQLPDHLLPKKYGNWNYWTIDQIEEMKVIFRERFDRVRIQELSRIVNRRIDTIRLWEKKDMLPEELRSQRDVRNWRYWTKEQVEGIKVWLKEKNRWGGFLENPTEQQLEAALRAMRAPRPATRRGRGPTNLDFDI